MTPQTEYARNGSRFSEGLRFTAALMLAAVCLVASCPQEAFAERIADSNISYNGDMFDGLISAEGNIFEDFDSILPGNELNGTVRITNDSDNKYSVYFHYADENSANKSEADHLLDMLSITITNQDTGEVIYDDVLRGSAGNEHVLLGEYAPGETVTLTYHMLIPSSLGNEYALSEMSSKWVFDVIRVADEYQKTGSQILGYVLGALLLLVIAALILMKSRKDRKRLAAADIDDDLDADLVLPRQPALPDNGKAPGKAPMHHTAHAKKDSSE